MASNARGRATRERLLDAAEEAMARHGLGVTMEDVAEAAGVTRSTVYRHLPDRDALVTEVVLRSAHRLGRRAAEAFDGPAPFPERLADVVVLIVGEVRDTPHLRALATAADTGRRWPDIDRDDELTESARAFFGPRLARAAAEGEVTLRADLDDTLDWLLRQTLLPLVVTGRRGTDDAAIRHDVETFVLPAILAD
jgi:AcrR family transcriptional regulator